jgi:hypothetical protein
MVNIYLLAMSCLRDELLKIEPDTYHCVSVKIDPGEIDADEFERTMDRPPPPNRPDLKKPSTDGSKTTSAPRGFIFRPRGCTSPPPSTKS